MVLYNSRRDDYEHNKDDGIRDRVKCYILEVLSTGLTWYLLWWVKEEEKSLMTGFSPIGGVPLLNEGRHDIEFEEIIKCSIYSPIKCEMSVKF